VAAFHREDFAPRRGDVTSPAVDHDGVASCRGGAVTSRTGQRELADCFGSLIFFRGAEALFHVSAPVAHPVAGLLIGVDQARRRRTLAGVAIPVRSRKFRTAAAALRTRITQGSKLISVP